MMWIHVGCYPGLLFTFFSSDFTVWLLSISPCLILFRIFAGGCCRCSEYFLHTLRSTMRFETVQPRLIRIFPNDAEHGPASRSWKSLFRFKPKLGCAPLIQELAHLLDHGSRVNSWRLYLVYTLPALPAARIVLSLDHVGSMPAIGYDAPTCELALAVPPSCPKAGTSPPTVRVW